MTIKSECVKLTAMILTIPIQIYNVESTLQIEKLWTTEIHIS